MSTVVNCRCVSGSCRGPGEEFGSHGLHLCGLSAITHPGVSGGVEYGEPGGDFTCSHCRVSLLSGFVFVCKVHFWILHTKKASNCPLVDTILTSVCRISLKGFYTVKIIEANIHACKSLRLECCCYSVFYHQRIFFLLLLYCCCLYFIVQCHKDLCEWMLGWNSQRSRAVDEHSEEAP